jgi:hypothetical protein
MRYGDGCLAREGWLARGSRLGAVARVLGGILPGVYLPEVRLSGNTRLPPQ